MAFQDGRDLESLRDVNEDIHQGSIELAQTAVRSRSGTHPWRHAEIVACA
jgi:hypothetical protein